MTGAPAIEGSTVKLTLTSASSVSETDTNVLVSYTKPTTGTDNKLTDRFGNEVADFTDTGVTNSTGSQKAGNTPAGGFAGVTGSGFVGETFTATTSDITDVDGMTGAVFTYQWKRGEPGGNDEDAVNIATGQSYTLTSDDEGMAVWVVVSFTDDRGALESVPSNKYIICAGHRRTTGGR